MSAEVIPLLARRRAEAEVLSHVYDVVTEKFGADVAATVVARAVEAAARQAGQAFAREAQAERPSLQHFAEVVEIWRRQDSLEVVDLSLAGNELRFEVIRCRYVELYRELGLPPALAYTLSCSRDAAFAAGYSPFLSLERSATLAEGSNGCRFRFLWGATAGVASSR